MKKIPLIIITILIGFNGISQSVIVKPKTIEIFKTIDKIGDTPYAVTVISLETKEKHPITQTDPSMSVSFTDKNAFCLSCEHPSYTEFICYFAYDAFDNFKGEANIHFGEPGVELYVIKNVNIQKIITPLDPLDIATLMTMNGLYLTTERITRIKTKKIVEYINERLKLNAESYEEIKKKYDYFFKELKFQLTLNIESRELDKEIKEKLKEKYNTELEELNEVDNFLFSVASVSYREVLGEELCKEIVEKTKERAEEIVKETLRDIFNKLFEESNKILETIQDGLNKSFEELEELNK